MIDLYNTKGFIKDPKAIGIVRKDTRWRPANYQHSANYLAGFWDGYNHIVTASGQFASGYLEMVYNSIVKNYPDQDVNINDYRDIPWDKLANLVHGGNIEAVHALYDHQKDAISSCAKIIGNVAHPCGVFDLATNAGKTTIIAEMLAQSGLKTIVVLHKEQLLKDMVKMFEKYELNVGYVTSATMSKVDTCDVLVVMYKSALNRHLKHWFDTAEALVVDECHRSGSDDFSKLLSKIRAPIRWGFSGSPFDGGNAMKVLSHFGNVLNQKSNQELIEAGVSAKVKVIMPEVTMPRTFDYDEAFAMMKVYPNRNNAMLKHLEKGKQFIIAVEHHDHAEVFESICTANGYNVARYDSTVKNKSALIEGFNDKTIEGLIVNSSGLEGLNLKDLHILLYARGGKSMVWLKQMLGRGLRLKSDTDTLLLVDPYDKDRYLKAGAAARLDYYKSQNFEVII